jgi:hypothetical protein
VWGEGMTRSGMRGREDRTALRPAMVTVTLIVIADIIIRIGQWDDGVVSRVVCSLSPISAILVSIGASYGGSLVYDHAFNVETAGDSPVWHEPETDVFAGQK